MASLPKPRYTPEQYLEIERAADFKSEYISGEILAMAGGTEQHNLIATNVSGELRQQLKGKPCRVYGSDMRVKAASRNTYFYPDVVVVCEEPRFEDERRDTLLNPTVIVEVLSRSTEAYDRGEKFEHYRSLDSLAAYILVTQDRIRIEQYVKQTSGQWVLSDVSAIGGSLTIGAIDSTLHVNEVYDKVDLSKPS